MANKEQILRQEAYNTSSKILRPEMNYAASSRKVFLVAEFLFGLLTINAIADLAMQDTKDGMIESTYGVVSTLASTAIADYKVRQHSRKARIYREVIESRPKEFQ